MNPISLGMTLFFTMIATTLLFIRVMVDAGLSWSVLAQILGSAVIIIALAGLGAFTDMGRIFRQTDASGLPART